MGCRIERVRGIIYDLDGTLVDTLADLAAAVNCLRLEVGLGPLPLPAVAACIGHGTSHLVRCALPDGDPELLLPRFREIYRGCQTEQTRPYPGVEEALAVIAGRGIPQAVLTNKPEDAAREILAAFGLSRRLDPILGAVPGRPLKPDPAVALQIAAGWGIPPAECLFVGDSEIDIETARRAGMSVVFIANGMGRRGAVQPDCEVSDFLVFLVEFCKAVALAGSQ